MKYTLRGVPPAVDAALRQRARATRKGLNETAVDALAEGVGLGSTQGKRRDFSDIVGTWVTEREVEEALAAQDVVDEELWR